MNAKSILLRALREMGADGLCNQGEECGCSEPCKDCNLNECIPARVVKLDRRFYPMEEKK